MAFHLVSFCLLEMLVFVSPSTLEKGNLLVTPHIIELGEYEQCYTEYRKCNQHLVACAV